MEQQLIETNIEQLTTEILVYKQQTAQNIIEIGRRLIKVKESLPHGEWGTYLKEKIQFSQRTANRFIQVSKEFSNSPSLTNLEPTKIFALLDLPQEERTDFMAQEHEIEGQTKTVDEMTTRELQQAIKDKKIADAHAKKLEETNKVLQESFNELSNKYNKEKNKEPKVVEKIVEIDNTDYHTIEKLKEELELKNKQYKVIKEKEELLKQKISLFEKDSKDYNDLKKQIESLTLEKENIGRQIESGISLVTLVNEIKTFLKTKLAPIQFSEALLEQKRNTVVISNVKDIVECVENWCKDIRKYLPENQQNIIDVEEYK